MVGGDGGRLESLGPDGRLPATWPVLRIRRSCPVRGLGDSPILRPRRPPVQRYRRTLAPCATVFACPDEALPHWLWPFFCSRRVGTGGVDGGRLLHLGGHSRSRTSRRRSIPGFPPRTMPKVRRSIPADPVSRVSSPGIIRAVCRCTNRRRSWTSAALPEAGRTSISTARRRKGSSLPISNVVWLVPAGRPIPPGQADSGRRRRVWK
jgi:hypothetical protein